MFYLASFFLLLINFLLASPVFANKEFSWSKGLYDYLNQVNFEYSYYAHPYDDSKHFPQTREQEILNHIENHFLKEHADKIFAGRFNPLEYTSSINIAKLLLNYGGQAFDNNILADFSWQSKRYKNIDPNLSHEEIIEIVKNNLNNMRKDYWERGKPNKNKIDLIKLYLSLGADINAKGFLERTPLTASLYIYVTFREGSSSRDREDIKIIPHIKPDEKHRADDIVVIKNFEGSSIISYRHHTYYRTPITYWLEEFIEAGYPASMLDTHKLLYPRFMKGASVEDVKDMLDNPKANAIKTNINCNYDKDEDETALICPLIPSINMRDAMGRTPLHIAGNEGNQAVYNYLKNNGADTSIKDYRGNSPTL